MKRPHSVMRYLRVAAAGLGVALLAAGCGILGEEDCTIETTRCSPDGVFQRCLGGEGYAHWQDEPCLGLDPVCVWKYSPGAICEDHATAPACPPGVRSLADVVTADWTPKSVADVDGDGNLDIVFLGAAHHLFVVRGTGGGAFATPTPVPSSLATIYDALAADVNGDRYPDLVLSVYTGSQHELDVLLGKGDGTFAPGPKHTVSEPFTFYSAMDMDADGREDVVAHDTYEFTSIDVLSHLADANVVQDNVAPTSPENLDYGGAAARFTRSGAPGLVAFTGSSAFVLLPQKDASYRQTALIDGGIAVADVDGDGLADVIASNTEAYLSQGDGTFHAAPTHQIPAGFGYVGAGDVDGDHHVDLVGFYGSSGFIALLKGHGDGTFEGPVSFTAGDWSNWSNGSWLTADFDGDGRLDIAVRAESGGILVLRGACTVQ